MNFVRLITGLVFIFVLTMVSGGIVFLLTPLKFVPHQKLRAKGLAFIYMVASSWPRSVAWWMKQYNTKYEVHIDPMPEFEHSAILVSNHQSWVDIPILCRFVFHKVPPLRFFMKRPLLFIPIFGVACWTLDFPVMRRITKEQAAKDPSLRTKDLETVRRACKNFVLSPTTIVNFSEGTRFTPAKRAKQDSPFQSLLKPKAGGVSYVLSAMAEQIDYIIDVTISYPDGVPTFIDFLSGKVRTAKVWVHVHKLPEDIREAAMQQSSQLRPLVQNFLNNLWQDKALKLAIR